MEMCIRDRFKALQSVHLHKECQVQGTVNLKDILAVDGQFLPEDFKAVSYTHLDVYKRQGPVYWPIMTAGE